MEESHRTDHTRDLTSGGKEGGLVLRDAEPTPSPASSTVPPVGGPDAISLILA